MITKEILNDYEFNSIEDYFDYIIESKINGVHSQSKQLFNDLSDNEGMQKLGQKNHFFNYVNTLYNYDLSKESMIEFMDELIKYFNYKPAIN